MARRVRRHVGHDDVGGAAQEVDELPRGGFVEEIELDEIDSGKRVDQEESMPTTRPLPWALPTLAAATATSPRRRAEIDHALAGLQEVMLLVDLQELVGRPRAVAFALRPGDVGR